MYKLLRSILFLLEPEQAHYISMNLLRFLFNFGLFRNLASKLFRVKSMPLHSSGLVFRNPVGLGAGFDKNAAYLRELDILGFGFVEIGTVTPKAQEGNDKPRLFRLKKDNALINRMGFNNDGADVIAQRLIDWRLKHGKKSDLLVGGNIGKNKNTPNEDAWKDYEICFNKLYDHVDYFAVNVSSPNTPGLRALQEKSSLKKILENLQSCRKEYKVSKPIFLKIAPDLNEDELNDVIALAEEIKLEGLIISNTTLDRSLLSSDSRTIADKIGAGGLSGAPVKHKSTEMISYAKKRLSNNVSIIGSGGIFGVDDAEEKLRAGASLVQVWTGFIYEGPFIVQNIIKGLNQ